MDDEDNGILASVPGEYISQGSRLLPEAATALQEHLSAVIDADWLGVVRVHYQRQKMRHGKDSHWAWVAYRAEREPDGKPTQRSV